MNNSTKANIARNAERQRLAGRRTSSLSPTRRSGSRVDNVATTQAAAEEQRGSSSPRSSSSPRVTNSSDGMQKKDSAVKSPALATRSASPPPMIVINAPPTAQAMRPMATNDSDLGLLTRSDETHNPTAGSEALNGRATQLPRSASNTYLAGGGGETPASALQHRENDDDTDGEASGGAGSTNSSFADNAVSCFCFCFEMLIELAFGLDGSHAVMPTTHDTPFVRTSSRQSQRVGRKPPVKAADQRRATSAHATSLNEMNTMPRMAVTKEKGFSSTSSHNQKGSNPSSTTKGSCASPTKGSPSGRSTTNTATTATAAAVVSRGEGEGNHSMNDSIFLQLPSGGAQQQGNAALRQGNTNGGRGKALAVPQHHGSFFSTSFTQNHSFAATNLPPRQNLSGPTRSGGGGGEGAASSSRRVGGIAMSPIGTPLTSKPSNSPASGVARAGGKSSSTFPSSPLARTQGNEGDGGVDTPLSNNSMFYVSGEVNGNAAEIARLNSDVEIGGCNEEVVGGQRKRLLPKKSPQPASAAPVASSATHQRIAAEEDIL